MSTSPEKNVSEGVETTSKENAPERTTELAPEHREFLLHHHGTFDLDPIPAPDETDPLNWPTWKVRNVHDDIDSSVY
jgi:hypothetical protein